MLPTEKASTIHDYMYKLGLRDNPIKTYEMNGSSQISYAQHLYILSDDKIEEGDWYIEEDIFYNNPLQASSECVETINQAPHNWKKIIATTDKELDLPSPSQSFIEKYITEYNKGNVIKDVLVEYEEMSGEELGVDPAYYPLEERLELKTNPKDSTITITKCKDSWSREELKELTKRAFLYGHDKGDSSQVLADKDQAFNEWFEENL